MATRLAATIALLACAAAPALAQAPSTIAPERVGMSSERLGRLDAAMQALVDSSRAAGVASLVLRDGHVVHSAAYGWSDREAGRPLRTDALFRIASQTKALTSVAAMILVEEGRLTLTDPVWRWVPAFQRMSVATDSGPVPARRALRVRDLLTHSAGLSYGTDALVREAYEAAGLGPAAGVGWYFADKDEPICVTMDRLGTLPLVAQPGDRFVYGYGTDLLGCVVERVSGQSLDAFLRERILEPLGMDDTYFYVPEGERSRLATLYAAGDDGLQRAPDGPRGQGEYVDGPRVSYSGGAGLVSTLGDYGRFLQMLLNGGELDGVRILSPYGVSLMTRDHLGPSYGQAGLGFGLGFQVLTDPALAGRFGAPGAYGWGGAYATSYWVDPAERLVVVLMTQTMPAGPLNLGALRDLVYAAVEEPAALERH
ncbi:MAG TPA: serine hydrolase domain-containing protein [Longimicrobiales bacterium]|nr:serine hydrolase domain-containing protein [Longimicrobiales bacterium]